tara:strand:+ start:125 stop:673 length:549 start_codon:yes stop_codon:yes gene_type:complete
MPLTTVRTAGLADDAVTSAKIPADAVTNSELNLGSDYAFTGTVSGAGLSSPIASSVTVTSEGSATTTNMVQGLCKSWVNFNGTGSIAARDSFNHSSLTDSGNGRYTVTIASAMNSTNSIVVSGLCQDDASSNRHAAQISLLRTSGGSPFTTTTVKITTHHDGQTTSSQDMDFTTQAIHGDLA